MHFICAVMVFRQCTPSAPDSTTLAKSFLEKAACIGNWPGGQYLAPGRIQVGDFLCEFDRPTNPATRWLNASVEADLKNACFSSSRCCSSPYSDALPTSAFISLTAAGGTSIARRANANVASSSEAGSTTACTSPSELASSAFSESLASRISRARADPKRRARWKESPASVEVPSLPYPATN